ncbi:MAG: hypothetical protein ACP5SD_00890 [Elusimicrobiales bacterium]
MKRFFFVFLFILSAYFGYKNRYDIYAFSANLTGKIEISEDLSKHIKPNSMLYITLKNDKNIIFAVKEIINPIFPLDFKITRKNVLYPDISSFKIKLEAVINTHGEIGKIKPGDIYSSSIEANIISRNLDIKLDKIK